MVDASAVGVALAAGSAFCFAGNRAVGTGALGKKGSDPAFANYMSLLVGVPVALAASVLTFQIALLPTMTVFAVSLFVFAGIFHFGLGRTLSYTSIKHIGANPTSALLTTQALYSLLLAVILLGENLNLGVVAGTLMIVLGIAFMEVKMSAAKRGGLLKFGYITALGAGLIFGISPIFVKAGLQSFHYYAPATLVSFAAALAVFTFRFPPPKFAASFRTTPKGALLAYFGMGVFGISAQLLRYASLTLAPVVIVAPILATHPIFTMLLTRGFSRDAEVFTARTVTSITIAAVGAVLVGFSAGLG